MGGAPGAPLLRGVQPDHRPAPVSLPGTRRLALLPAPGPAAAPQPRRGPHGAQPPLPVLVRGFNFDIDTQNIQRKCLLQVTSPS